jgi:hypothetical protein
MTTSSESGPLPRLTDGEMAELLRLHGEATDEHGHFISGEYLEFLHAAHALTPRLAAEVKRLRLWVDGMESLSETHQEEIARLTAEVARLRAAIREHRDQRGDDRCWMDDETLYAALPEGFTPPTRDAGVELANCARFIACRGNPKTEYVSPQREIDRLRAECGELRRALERAHDAGRRLDLAEAVAHIRAALDAGHDAAGGGGETR